MLIEKLANGILRVLTPIGPRYIKTLTATTHLPAADLS